jgi:uncharacterized protein GlcG (DUF336 family)
LLLKGGHMLHLDWRRWCQRCLNRRVKLSIVIAGIFSAGLATAVDLPKEPVLPLEMAYQAAIAAIKECKKGGYVVSAAVVDQSGVLKVLLRSDKAGPHTVDSSRRKAYAAASLREPTGKLAALIGQRPELQALRDMNESILILGGGLPIKIYDNVVGGIGVGGAPGAALDEACARAGLKTIDADEYKPKKE